MSAAGIAFLPRRLEVRPITGLHLHRRREILRQPARMIDGGSWLARPWSKREALLVELVALARQLDRIRRRVA